LPGENDTSLALEETTASRAAGELIAQPRTKLVTKYMEGAFLLCLEGEE
jgi:hypothetical protein